MIPYNIFISSSLGFLDFFVSYLIVEVLSSSTPPQSTLGILINNILNVYSSRLLASILFSAFSAVLFCYFIWDMFVCLLIMAAFMCLFLCIR